MKKKVIKIYGNGCAKQCAEFLGMSHQRVRQWSEDMSVTQIDGVIAKLVRLGQDIPSWLLK